jgi:hypothetical protein
MPPVNQSARAGEACSSSELNAGLAGKMKEAVDAGSHPARRGQSKRELTEI